MYEVLYETLHSTMFLLILSCVAYVFETVESFTFHNVSINTVYYGVVVCYPIFFTFHNVSINTFAERM